MLSGSFRKDLAGLRTAFESLRDLGCSILSPANVDPVREDDGFVYMNGETSLPPTLIERNHLNAIEAAEFVWLHAPDGYVGLSASLEIGFANAVGVPVFSAQAPQDPVLQTLVTVVGSPEAAISCLAGTPRSVPQSFRSFQHYYRRIAEERGYSNESARDCVLLMIEEIGELARAIRKSSGLTRHHTMANSTGLELADVFLYVVHLANTLRIDLQSVVDDKERINRLRFLSSQRQPPQ